MRKYIHLNLKRFDVNHELGGVNYSENPLTWGSSLMIELNSFVEKISKEYNIDFVVYFPEAHIIPAREAITSTPFLKLGCQSVYKEDISLENNFGAFTSHRPASSMSQLGVTNTIVGHFEERKDKIETLMAGGVKDFDCVNDILNKEIKAAQNRKLKVLYCIGETSEQKKDWKNTLRKQLQQGLADTNLKEIAIAYEPLWAIGPGKTPPTKNQIEKISKFIKTIVPNVPLLYGGGLKKENAREISKIGSLEGGLIALTHFNGKIGFYPDEFKEIVNEFIKNEK